MSSIRDIKRKARRDLHNHAKVAALYIAPVPDAVPVPLSVRIHSKWDATTMDSGTGNGTLASRQNVFPKILFMLDELDAAGVTLRKKGVISVEAGEAYKLDNDEAVDDISQSWLVVAMRTSETVGLPVPSDSDG